MLISMNTTTNVNTMIINDEFNVLGSTVATSSATVSLVVVATIENGDFSLLESVTLDGVVYLLGKCFTQNARNQ